MQPIYNPYMMTLSNGNIFRVTDPCAGNSPVTGEFPTQRLVTRSFDVFFDLRLNKSLSKQSWGWWFETSSRPLWRHCNDTLVESIPALKPTVQYRISVRRLSSTQISSKLVRKRDFTRFQFKMCFGRILLIMGRMGICFTSVATSLWGEACSLLLCFPGVHIEETVVGWLNQLRMKTSAT